MKNLRKNVFFASSIATTLFAAIVYGQGAPPVHLPPGAITTPSVVGGSPGAAFGGGITHSPLPVPAIDPYQLPGTSPMVSPGPILPGPTGPYPHTVPFDRRFSGGPSSLNPTSPFPNGQYLFNRPSGGVSQYTRFLQGVSVEYTWLYGQDDDELGINDLDLSATFAFPIFPNRDHPLLVSPGLAVHWWEGPAWPATAGPPIADLPPVAYDAYLDFTWRPNLSEWISAELAFRPGVYSDFSSVTSDSIRLQGRAMLYISTTPTFQIAGGIVYLDRLDVKLLPSGGVIWTPNPKARYEILFPKPKLARYWFTSGTNTEWWWYVTGEYGGGSWTIDRARADPMRSGFEDRIDINDIRIGGGLEFRPPKSLDSTPQTFGRSYIGYIEAAYVFEREILYKSWRPRSFDLSDTVMVRAGIRF